MKQTIVFAKKAFLIGWAMVVGASVFGQAPEAVIYDNSINYLGQFFFTPNEFGDQIVFSATEPERTITNFKIEYYVDPVMADNNETVQVRLYQNDGVGQSPGTLLYDTGIFSIASGINYVNLQNMNLRVQDGLTWTVLFGGIDPGDTAGLLLFDPPTIGTSFNDFWEKSGADWGTKTIAGVNANFGAQVIAVPEPSTVALMLLGSLAGLGLMLRRRD
jgi:hypothetical protein